MSSIVSLSELLRGGESRAMINTRNKNEILALNEKTKQYGLTLTEAQAKELVITRNNALRENSMLFGIIVPPRPATMKANSSTKILMRQSKISRKGKGCALAANKN